MRSSPDDRANARSDRPNRVSGTLRLSFVDQDRQLEQLVEGGPPELAERRLGDR
jgi:hypothetical protein